MGPERYSLISKRFVGPGNIPGGPKRAQALILGLTSYLAVRTNVVVRAALDGNQL